MARERERNTAGSASQSADAMALLASLREEIATLRGRGGEPPPQHTPESFAADRVDRSGAMVPGAIDLSAWVACGLCTQEEADTPLWNPKRPNDGLYGFDCFFCKKQARTPYTVEYTFDEYKAKYKKPPYGKGDTLKPKADEVIVHATALCFNGWAHGRDEVAAGRAPLSALTPVEDRKAHLARHARARTAG